MTITEFDNTSFSVESKVIYDGTEYEIAAVDFDEKLIGFEDPSDTTFDDELVEKPQLRWVRCENCTLV